MRYLRFRWYHALILYALAGAALAGCQPINTAPTDVAATRAAVVAPSAAGRPTASGPSPLAIARRTAAATVLPSPAPATPIPPRQSATLPADQPWFLVSAPYAPCGASSSTFHLVAIARGGQQTQLDRYITAVGERPGAPPLLATCDADGSAAILDPIDWTAIKMALEPRTVVLQVLVAPDQQRALLRTTCPRCPEWVEVNQMLNLRSGTLQWASALPASFSHYDNAETVTLLGWGDEGVYYFTERNKAGGTRFAVTDPDDPQSDHTLAKNANYVLGLSHDLLVAIDSQPATDSMTLLDLHHGTTQTIDQADWLSVPAIAPDGTALAYFRSRQLVIFDIIRRTKIIVSDALGSPLELYTHGMQNSPTVWSPDGQRLVVATDAPRRGQQAFLLARDGTLISSVPLPNGGVFGVTGDDDLLMDKQVNGVSWLPLRPGAAPYAPDIVLSSEISIAPAYLPPSGRNAAPAPRATAATPLPVTQLPTPAIPTPLAAAPAAIKLLGDAPSDATLFTHLPVDQHVLYQAHGALYSQALRGGAAQFLGGDNDHPAELLVITPDRKTLIYRLSDAVYRVPIAGGRSVRITPPLVEGAETGILSTEFSQDGRYLVYGVTGPKPAAWKDQLREIDSWTVALYRVPVTGGPAVRLTPPLDPDSEISTFMVSPDSRHVYYMVGVPDTNFPLGLGGGITTSGVALYSVSIEGGTPLRLATSESADDLIGGWGLSADGQYIQYNSRSGSTSWRVAVAGTSPPVRLGAPGTPREDANIDIANDGWVLSVSAGGIYIAPSAGGPPVKLANRADVSGDLYDMRLTPDGTHVILITSNALYWASMRGGTTVRLSQVPSLPVWQPGFALTNERVIYQDADAIYAIGLSGGKPVRLTPALPPDTTLTMEKLSPDLRYVVYTIEQTTDRTRAIYSVPVGGGAPVVLLAGSSDGTKLWSIKGGYAIGKVNQILYAAPLGGGQGLQLSAPTDKVGEEPVFSDDGRQVIYVAHRDQLSPDFKALYVATLPAGRP